MVEAKKGKLMSKDGKSIAARVDEFSTVYLKLMVMHILRLLGHPHVRC
jgi:hypothetical protein